MPWLEKSPLANGPTVTDAFIDTNVLRYAASDAPNEAPKAAISQTLLESLDFAVSVQVGAKIIYSEDLAQGQDYDGIKGVNPFLQQPAT